VRPARRLTQPISNNRCCFSTVHQPFDLADRRNPIAEWKRQGIERFSVVIRTL
jgi:hypothetical protein